MRINHSLPIFVAALLLGGCGTQISAPSLMPRAVEKQPIDMPLTDAPERESPADPALQAQIATQVAAAEAGDRAFEGQTAAAQTAVAHAAGAGKGSEAWIQAEEAVTALESARTAVRDAAAAIDALRDDPANAATGNRDAIDAAAKQVGAIEDKEATTVAALNAKLG